MKNNFSILISAAAASGLALAALPEELPGSHTRGATNSHSLEHGYRGPREGRLGGAAKASEIIGMAVKTYQNEKLGKVDELAVDLESGRVLQVILSTGGLLGIGDTLTAVPPGALHHDVVQTVLHLDASKEKLKSAVRFDNAQWASNSDQSHLTAVYGYYGEESSLNFIHPGDSSLDDGRRQDTRSRNDRPRNEENRRPRDVSKKPDPTRPGAEAWDQNQQAGDRLTLIPVSRLGQIQKASKLMGTPIKNLQQEALGKVDNLMVDLASGRILAVIISSGGFLGMGGELSAVPPSALRFSNDRATLQLDASKDLLTGAPHFHPGEWPDFAQPTYAEGVYRAYKIKPYFTPNPATQADNTGQNVRDRDGSNLTPLDQGNSSADVQTTAQIRQEIVAAKNMSLNARNVKIITNNGKVTLRGPVNTAEEQRVIGEIANRIATSDNVRNQLEVTAIPNRRN